MSNRITMAQVGQRAGVHPTTVSLALRNHPSIPPVTRDRIRAIADEMGYRPDPALNALTAYRHTILPRREMPPLAYLTHWDSEWGWKQSRAQARFHSSVVAKASALGYRLEHFWLGEPGLSHRRMSDILHTRGITGLIVASHLPENDGALGLDWTKFSAVKIDCLPHDPVLHHVTSDHRAIGQLSMHRIQAAGYRRIGVVMPRWWDECTDLAWSAGVLAEQQRLEPEERIPILSYAEEPGAARGSAVPAKLFADWMAQHRPEVLLAKSQFVQPRLDELGLVVPRDVAFVEMYLDPDGRTAGVRHNCERAGALAVEILVGQLQRNEVGIPEFPIASLVQGTWFDGATLPARAKASAERRRLVRPATSP